MFRRAPCRMIFCMTIFCMLLLASAFASAQNPDLKGIELKGKAQLTRNGRRINDASKVVVWLTPLGTTPAPPPQQQAGLVPQLIQKIRASIPRS